MIPITIKSEKYIKRHNIKYEFISAEKRINHLNINSIKNKEFQFHNKFRDLLQTILAWSEELQNKFWFSEEIQKYIIDLTTLLNMKFNTEKIIVGFSRYDI